MEVRQPKELLSGVPNPYRLGYEAEPDTHIGKKRKPMNGFSHGSHG